MTTVWLFAPYTILIACKLNAAFSLSKTVAIVIADVKSGKNVYFCDGCSGVAVEYRTGNREVAGLIRVARGSKFCDPTQKNLNVTRPDPLTVTFSRPDPTRPAGLLSWFQSHKMIRAITLITCTQILQLDEILTRRFTVVIFTSLFEH